MLDWLLIVIWLHHSRGRMIDCRRWGYHDLDGALFLRLGYVLQVLLYQLLLLVKDKDGHQQSDDPKQAGQPYKSNGDLGTIAL
jgi:hypothetical protein